MTLILILIALGLDYFSGQLEPFRNVDWFLRLHDWLEKRLSHHALFAGTPGLLLLLSIPIVGLLLLLLLFVEIWIVQWFLALLVLLYCLAPENLNARLERYITAMDDAASNEACVDLMDKKLSDKEDCREIAMIKSVIHESHARIFAVIFWFLVLGPVGALLYRLVHQLNDKFFAIHSVYADSVRLLLNILEWPSSRLMIIGLALSGNLVGVLPSCRNSNHLNFESNKTLLIGSAMGALQYSQGLDGADSKAIYWIRELKSLLNRTLFVWLAILGLMVLGGIAN